MKLIRQVLSAGVGITLSLGAAQQLSGQDASAQTGSPEYYSRYNSPNECVMAVNRLHNQYWRDKRPDTVSYGPEQDSIPAMAIEGGRACAAKFSVASVAEDQLFSLARLYWMIGDDDKAQQAVDRMLAAPRYKDTEHRAYVLQQMVSTLASMRPTRVDLAGRYLNQLQAMGQPAAMFRSLGLYSFSLTMLSHGNVDSSHTLASLATTAMREMDRNDKVDIATTLLTLYGGLAEPISVKKNSIAAFNFIDSAQAELLPLRPVDSRPYQGLQAGLRNMRSPYNLMGTPAQPLTADSWYNIQEGDTILPRSDMPTIVFLGGASCGAFCYPAYSTLRTLHRDYSDKGIKFVISTSTGGFYRNKLIESNAELDSTGKYFVDFLELPVVVSANITEFERMQDGRRRNAPVLNSRHYSRGRNAVIVGKDGIVKLVVSLGPTRERLIRQTLDLLY